MQTKKGITNERTYPNQSQTMLQFLKYLKKILDALTVPYHTVAVKEESLIGETMPPKKQYLNDIILEVIKTYPTDGTHTYWWENGFDGVTYDIKYKGEIVAKSEEKKRTYCCGITWEVFLSACERFAKLNGKDDYTLDNLQAWGVRKMKSDWFVATGKRGGALDALVSRGLGEKVEFENAQAGDFLQLWRPNGSGHSTIFLGMEGDKIKYWSTQPKTNGIGINTEKKYDELYFVRASVPILDGAERGESVAKV